MVEGKQRAGGAGGRTDQGSASVFCEEPNGNDFRPWERVVSQFSSPAAVGTAAGHPTDTGHGPAPRPLAAARPPLEEGPRK